MGEIHARIYKFIQTEYLYVSNRGGKSGKHQCLAINKNGDLLTNSVSPSGKYLIVGWQNTDNLTSYEIQDICLVLWMNWSAKLFDGCE